MLGDRATELTLGGDPLGLMVTPDGHMALLVSTGIGDLWTPVDRWLSAGIPGRRTVHAFRCEFSRRDDQRLVEYGPTACGAGEGTLSPLLVEFPDGRRMIRTWPPRVAVLGGASRCRDCHDEAGSWRRPGYDWELPDG